jgi:anti-sigma-K factor RskA
MLAAHALGALDAAERRALEAHLSSCAECRAELDQWQGTAAALAYAAPPGEPSPDLRGRILQDARSRPRVKPGASARPASAESSARAPEASETSEARKVLPFAPARRRWSAPAIIGALAAGLAFAALALSIFLLWQRNVRQQAELAQLRERLDQTQSELARAREMQAPLASPDAQATMLAGTKAAPRAHAMLAFDKRTGRTMLLAYDLPPAPEGKAYQLWFIADGHVMPGGVFTPDARGHAELRDQMPDEGLKAPSAIFAVTLEPAGGTRAPTGDKYLLSPTS